jgi:hypothetical protein
VRRVGVLCVRRLRSSDSPSINSTAPRLALITNSRAATSSAILRRLSDGIGPAASPHLRSEARGRGNAVFARSEFDAPKFHRRVVAKFHHYRSNRRPLLCISRLCSLHTAHGIHAAAGPPFHSGRTHMQLFHFLRCEPPAHRPSDRSGHVSRRGWRWRESHFNGLCIFGNLQILKGPKIPLIQQIPHIGSYLRLSR